MVHFGHVPPAEYGFPTALIHVNDYWTMERWKFLWRGYDGESEFKQMIDVVRDNTMVTYDGQLTLLSQARYCEENNIPGDYVEMGSWKGGCIGLMALANLKYGKNRRTIHAFDSFEGLPGPNDKDFDDHFVDVFKIKKKDNAWEKEPIRDLVASQRDVESLVLDRIHYPQEKTRMYAGWFQDTLPAAAENIGQIAILRLDGDLYVSYMVSLEYLYKKVVKGGFVIIDDWIFKGCRDAVNEFFTRNGATTPYLSTSDATTRYFRKME